MAEFFKKKKKVCYMCTGKDIDYKDIDTLKKYTNDKGKILPRRMTGACALHQRDLPPPAFVSTAQKRSPDFLAPLLPAHARSTDIALWAHKRLAHREG